MDKLTAEKRINELRDLVRYHSRLYYELDTPETITVNELNEAVNNREIYLATVRKQREEYKASKNNAAPSPAAAPAKGAFNF